MKALTPYLVVINLAVWSQCSIAANPVEFWGCKFNDGKDMSDLTSWTAQWNEVVDQLPDDGYNAWVMTPMFKSNMSDLDFLWVGAWPDFSMMGSGLDGFFNGKEGSAVFAKFLEITTCEIHDLYSSTQVRENSGD
ncbi:hypothetical protein PQZ11_05130 [Luminiphilus sp.]|jgi:hypothetical protein|nr:hypothetical protein [Luminiphilus sp.]MDB2689520.1 hypothetical protein [Luminiphilus sp.]MDC0572563.1 hypothetical protein [Luminiphilus sp.]MDC6472429.1 hypothetical protein [Luminiphilus sp.]